MLRSAAPPATPHVARFLCSLAALALLAPAAVQGQSRDRDARIPQPGSLWIAIAPDFYSWNEQFAQGSAGVGDGSREPLFSDYDGSVAARLFPGLDPMLDVVNRDAGALGFTPLTESELALGNLDFGSIDVSVRRIPLEFQYGIGGFAAIEVSVPLVETEVETGFVFDSASAAVLRAESALSDPGAFFSQLDAAQAQLQGLLDGGTLSPADSAAAAQLLSDTEAFQGALDSRVSDQGYLFTAGSSAGQQITGYYGGFETGFQAFGITLPGFSLPDTATRADLNAYFQGDPVLGQPLGKVTRGWAFSNVEVGARFKLFDTFGWPERPEPTAAVPADEDLAAAHAPPRNAAPDSMEAVPDSMVVARDSAKAEPEPPEPIDRPGIRYRTTVGARYRFPLSEPDSDPNLDPDYFLQQPIGTGSADIELEVYQDVAFGSRLLVVAGATYGIQLQDDLVRRVAPPGQPYAYASQKVTVSRDLGDFLQVVISPRFALAEAMSLAVEYTFWNKKSDVYESSSAGVDATPLGLETSQTRHMLGIGAYYRTTRLFAAGRAGMPIDLAFLWQTSIAGSGGLTPAAGITTLSARIPIQLF
ncbi:MAG: hypothetical protein Q8W45_07785 [Candidatus Palauibacterales bacterium]|nr:hypothetical protein [Candidatus Palauibacterales bacterium]MDP2483168.1 hypothetical protein [Candidatus Palauibacterales bacterium]